MLNGQNSVALLYYCVEASGMLVFAAANLGRSYPISLRHSFFVIVPGLLSIALAFERRVAVVQQWEDQGFRGLQQD
jgi:hypothetical protein